MFKFILILFLCLFSSNIQRDLSLIHTMSISLDEPKNDPREVTCLAKVIYHESGNQSGEGKAAVASIVFNRMQKTNKGVCDTVYSKGQFSSVRKFKRPIKIVTWMSFYHLANSILIDYNKGLWKDNVKAATYFHSRFIKNPWRTKRILKVAVIGDHIFYKEN